MTDKAWIAISSPPCLQRAQAAAGTRTKLDHLRFCNLPLYGLPFLKEENMSRFIVIHGAPPAITQDQVVDGAKSVVASLPADAEWLNSWAAGPEAKLICEWEAPDPEAIRAALEPIKDLFPIETMYEVEWIDPQWYK
jgi:hypothetical protein